MNNSQEEKPINEFLLTFADLIQIVRKSKKTIYRSAIFFAILALGYGLTKPIEYQAEATFKEKGKSQSGLGNSLSATFFLLSDQIESNAMTILRSRKLMEHLIKEQGLQGIIVKDAQTFPFLPFHRIKNNLLIEYAAFKNLQSPVLSDPEVDFRINEITYNDEISLALHMKVLSKEKYAIYDAGSKKVEEGSFNTPFSTKNYSFTLNQANDAPLVSGAYTLVLLPLKQTAQSLIKRFTIELDCNDKSLIKIAYTNPDRKLASENINSLMALYQKHIQCEHESACETQVNYLSKKLKEMGTLLEKMLQEYADHLSSDLSSTGFASSEKAIEFLANTQYELKQKLWMTTLDVQRLQKQKSEDFADHDIFSSLNNFDVVNRLSNEKRHLKQQADSLNLVLRNIPVNSKEFQGINLTIAKELYVAYNRDLSSAESTSTQYEFIVNQLDDPNFEISSLSTILTDNLSLEMISKSNNLTLSLKDQDNRSSKEQERLNAELAILKSSLKTHVQQSISLLALRQQFLKEKIQHLQSVNLSLIQEEISILDNQIKEYIGNSLENLIQEKELIENNLADLRIEMSSFPKKWAAEQLIEQQMEINKSMVEEISKLVESKNITNNLEKLQSAPLDLAFPPIQPKPPRLILLTIMGAIAGSFLSFIWILAWSVLNGVQASSNNLIAAGQYVCGSFSRKYQGTFDADPLLDSDLTTLRRLIAFMESSKDQTHSLLLLQGKGPDYSSPLAKLLAVKGLKTLVIDLHFGQAQDVKESGILQYLEGKASRPMIVHLEGYDKIETGGICRYANELVGSQRFHDLLAPLSEQYDWILISSDASPNSAEGESLMDIFPIAAISITEESTRDLKNCIECAKDKKNKIAFIITSKPL